MAKQTINLGTSANSRDGDPLRIAFGKINENFDELYAKDATDVSLSAINASLIPDTDVTYDIGSATNRFKDLYLSGSTIDLGGTTLSVVGGELQLGGTKVPTQADLDQAIVDVVAGSVDLAPYATVASLADIATSGSWTDLTSTPTTLAGYGITDTYTQAEVDAAIAAQQHLPQGDLQGSVFADDSTLLVDGVNGKIVGDIDTSSLTLYGRMTTADLGGGQTTFRTTETNQDGDTLASVWLQSLTASGMQVINDPAGDSNTLYSTVEVEASSASLTSAVQTLAGDEFGRVLVAPGFIQLRAGTPAEGTQVWQFNNDGTIQFPDSTLQSTAWTGNVPGFTYNESGGTSEIGVTADVFDFGDGKTIDMQNSTVLFTGSTVSGILSLNTDYITIGVGGSINMQGSDIGAAGSISAVSISTLDLTTNTVRSEGDINISVNLTDSTTRNWAFTEGGDLTLPNGYVVNSGEAGVLSVGSDRLGVRLNSTDQSTLMVAKQSFNRTFDETFDAGYTLSILNTPNRVRVTFDANNGLYFRGLMERWTILYDDIRNALTSDFEYDYSNIRLSLEPDTYDIVTNVVDVAFVSDNVYDIEIDQDPIVVLADAGAEPGEIGQIALRYDYNNTVGFDVDRNRYGMAVDHEDIDLRAGRDVDLYAVDDFRARAGSAFNLSLIRNDNQAPDEGININLESNGGFLTADVKSWTFQFDGKLRLPENGDIVDSTGNSVLSRLDGDFTGSVFADDSTLLVDGVNGRLVGPLLTNSIASPATGNLELDVGRENGGAFIVTAWADKSDLGNGWKQILWGYDGDRYEFYVGGDIATQGSITTNNVTANGLIARQGQYLYVTSAHAGGTATNVAFTYNTGIGNVSQTFYGKTEFANNGLAPIVDFGDATIENWTDPNVVNTHSGSTVIAVGGQTATIDKLTVRLVNDGSNNIDVQFNYDPDVTSAISASGDSDNRFGGTTTLAPGNTTWTTLNSITTVGTTRTFTVSDQSFHKVYRGTVICRALPDGGGTAGDAYCILERLL